MEARQLLQREGYTASHIAFQHSADLRYVGQNPELRVPWPGLATQVDRESLVRLAQDFEAAHEQTYGHGGVDQQIELVNLRLVAVGCSEASRFLDQLRVVQAAVQGTEQAARSAYFGPVYGWLPTQRTSRPELTSMPQPGPILIEEIDATILVPPDFEVSCDRWGCMVMTPSHRHEP